LCGNKLVTRVELLKPVRSPHVTHHIHQETHKAIPKECKGPHATHFCARSTLMSGDPHPPKPSVASLTTLASQTTKPTTWHTYLLAHKRSRHSKPISPLRPGPVQHSAKIKVLHSDCGASTSARKFRDHLASQGTVQGHLHDSPMKRSGGKLTAHS